MTAATRTIGGPDGRALRIHDAGDPDGTLIVFHHGTPSGGLLHAPWVEHAALTGVRLVGYDRPGYGGSAPQPGRTVAGAAADAVAIADALGAGSFATFGTSGGGPHALACAARAPDRVTAVAVLGSVAPFEAGGLNYFAGMGRDNWIEFGAALHGRATLEPFLAEQSRALAGAAPEDLAEEMRTLVGEHDQRALDAGLAVWMHATAAGGLAPGPQGWVDDDLAFVEPWGFELAGITVPALVWHGHHDRFVPVAHGEWLARTIPGAEARIDPDEAHLSLLAHRIPALLDWLRERLG